jgi:hypothetical protein
LPKRELLLVRDNAAFLAERTLLCVTRAGHCPHRPFFAPSLSALHEVSAACVS